MRERSFPGKVAIERDIFGRFTHNKMHFWKGIKSDVNDPLLITMQSSPPSQHAFSELQHPSRFVFTLCILFSNLSHYSSQGLHPFCSSRQLRHNADDALQLRGPGRSSAHITYCILPGWPLGGPSVLCRPARAARTRCCKWCRRCHTQAGWTPHTQKRTHTDRSGHHRSPQMCICHRTHLNGQRENKGLI